MADTHCTKCEKASYHPEREHYLGQFPIDYISEKFELMSTKEANDLPDSSR